MDYISSLCSELSVQLYMMTRPWSNHLGQRRASWLELVITLGTVDDITANVCYMASSSLCTFNMGNEQVVW